MNERGLAFANASTMSYLKYLYMRRGCAYRYMYAMVILYIVLYTIMKVKNAFLLKKSYHYQLEI